MVSGINSNPVDHSVWVEDWSEDLDAQKYISSLPRGVNTINIFVGQLDKNGTIDGFSEDTPGKPAGTGAFKTVQELRDFIQQLRAKGLNVNLSIGGQDGTVFGDSWDNLTTGNIQTYAQALNNLCKYTGATGVNFDDEHNDSSAALAGQLAAALKTLDPSLELSDCVMAGINSQGPWHQEDSEVLENATMPNGTSAFSQVDIMAYYDGATLAQNETFVTDWLSYLKKWGFTASQVSVGVDPNDSITGKANLAAWIQFCAHNGFSTAIWDQSGVDDYVQNDWGDKIAKLYGSEKNF